MVPNYISIYLFKNILRKTVIYWWFVNLGIHKKSITFTRMSSDFASCPSEHQAAVGEEPYDIKSMSAVWAHNFDFRSFNSHWSTESHWEQAFNYANLTMQIGSESLNYSCASLLEGICSGHWSVNHSHFLYCFGYLSAAWDGADWYSTYGLSVLLCSMALQLSYLYWRLEINWTSVFLIVLKRQALWILMWL